MTYSITIRPTWRVLNMQDKSRRRIHCPMATVVQPCARSRSPSLSLSSLSSLQASLFWGALVSSSRSSSRSSSAGFSPASICCANIYCNLCEKQRFMITFGNWVVIYIISESGPKRIRQLWSVVLAPGLRGGGGINSPGNVTRQQKFPQVVQSFWISFWCFLFFFSLFLILLLLFCCVAAFRVQSLFSFTFQSFPILLQVFRKKWHTICQQNVASPSVLAVTEIDVERRRGGHSCPE